MSETNWNISPGDIVSDLEYRSYQNLLAHLLINEVVFLNAHSGGMMAGGVGEGISVNVICSDTFSYACADCERLDYGQIPALYRQWQRDPLYGPTAWCITRRRERPITPVANRMVELGYDLDALMKGELP